MTFRQLELFLAASRCQSLNRAAKMLDISQQALQAAINSLEKQLGCALFSRSRSGLTLTESGKKFALDVEKILDTASSWAKLKYATGPLAVRIVGTVSMINMVASSLVLEFRAKYPHVSLELMEMGRKNVIGEALARPVIGIFGAARPDEIARIRQKLGAEKRELVILGSDDYAVFINSGLPLAQKKSLCLADLARFTPALYPGDAETFCYKAVYGHFSKTALPYYASRQESVLRLVIQNPAIAAIFPKSALLNPNIQRDKLRALPLRDFPMPGLNCLAHPARDMLSDMELELVCGIRAICSRRSYPSR